ncbi:MAG TPA: fumarylacetoacetate hydrolase family protein [Vicinamibacteria bacterium]|nr:fumarylacetoacetate hydrolase family protein [Vicinamibacteria bacterium]
MKLIRFGQPGAEKPGLLLPDGARVDASGFGSDWGEGFLGGDGLVRLAAWARDHAATAPRVPATERLGPPIARPSKIVCIGLNYADHARETGAKIPDEPIIFFKATTALSGPDDDLVLPRGSVKTDWEVEIAVVIGRRARYVAREDAAAHVAGYALHNDYSERQDQLERGGQWSKGKSHDTYAPLGPFLATPDEIADVHDLPMWLTVNGQTRQKSSTRQMVFRAGDLVSYLSRFMTLLPGDVISTGTPGGVGMGFDPPAFLRAGDVVELGIEGLGRQRQRVVPGQEDRR